MTINIDLPQELENELHTEAAELNLPLSAYIVRLKQGRNLLFIGKAQV